MVGPVVELVVVSVGRWVVTVTAAEEVEAGVLAVEAVVFPLGGSVGGVEVVVIAVGVVTVTSKPRTFNTQPSSTSQNVNMTTSIQHILLYTAAHGKIISFCQFAEITFNYSLR